MTQSFHTDAETFDKLYRGEPAADGAPAPAGIPWDIGQAQPRVMELEALGGISGEVLDIGCGLGDNSIYLASRGHSVTGIDGSPAAIAEAGRRADAAGVQVRFEVADATKLTGYDGRFDTVIDSALYHCLDPDGRQAYAAGLYRATRPGARLHLWCFSEGNVNGLLAPRPVPETDVRDTLTANGWRIDFLGPTTYYAKTVPFKGDDDLARTLEQNMPPEAVAHMREMRARFERVADLLVDERIHLPFTVVHAHRVD